jgi:predicted ArsR family transcriptional regulator
VKFRGLASTKVAELLLAGGPATASSLAQALGMTATAIRKHLEQLESAGYVSSHERAPFGPSENGPRGRGRPARVFAITASGREFFEESYDDFAVESVRFIHSKLGDEGVREYAQSYVKDALAELESKRGSLTPEQLSQELADLGFSASLRPAPVGDATQLCQHNCPISHVASEFPQFCDAETEAIGELLGVHVTRISTIASGSAICTTHIPIAKRGNK